MEGCWFRRSLRDRAVRDRLGFGFQPPLVIHHYRNTGVIPPLSAPGATPRAGGVSRKRLGVHGMAENALNVVHHDRGRDRSLAMSSESVASGASHNQLPTATGIIARLAMSNHRSGLSMATINPTVATVAAHAANTKSFR